MRCTKKLKPTFTAAYTSLFLLFFFLCGISCAFGQEETQPARPTKTKAPKQMDSTAVQTAKTQPPIVSVIDVYRLGDSAKSNTERNKAGIGDIIVVKV